MRLGCDSAATCYGRLLPKNYKSLFSSLCINVLTIVFFQKIATLLNAA